MKNAALKECLGILKEAGLTVTVDNLRGNRRWFQVFNNSKGLPKKIILSTNSLDDVWLLTTGVLIGTAYGAKLAKEKSDPPKVPVDGKGRKKLWQPAAAPPGYKGETWQRGSFLLVECPDGRNHVNSGDWVLLLTVGVDRKFIARRPWYGRGMKAPTTWANKEIFLYTPAPF